MQLTGLSKDWLVEHLEADSPDTPPSPSFTHEGMPPMVCYSAIIFAFTWDEARVFFVMLHCPGLDPFDRRFRCTEVKK
jgi:hypothetical protein